jgi:glycosyltransferase involved in cell wall biosynthesis
MSDVKISVCIPVYNGAEFIRQAITSVLEQDMNDFELLIVDNHSSDETVAVVKSFSDPRIRLVQNETNIGLIPNWNKALAEARGLYIKILPADDFLYQGCLRRQSAVLDADTGHRISMVCSRRHIVDDKGKVLFARGFSRKETRVPGRQAIARNIRSGGNIIGEGGSILFRRSVIEKTGVFTSDIFYVLDLDLWYKILLEGELHALPDIHAAFRVSGSSASVKVIRKQYEDATNFMKKIYTDKAYQVSWLTYRFGRLKVLFLTEAKKILYRYVLKS